MLAYGKLSRDMMAHGKGGDYIGLEFSGKVSFWQKDDKVFSLMTSPDGVRKCL